MHPRLIAKFLLGALDARQRMFDVPDALRPVLWRLGEAEMLRDYRVNLVQSVCSSGSDVEHAARGDRAGCLARQKVRVDGIVHVIEVAAGQTITEDGRRL